MKLLLIDFNLGLEHLLSNNAENRKCTGRDTVRSKALEATWYSADLHTTEAKTRIRPDARPCFHLPLQGLLPSWTHSVHFNSSWKRCWLKSYFVPCRFLEFSWTNEIKRSIYSETLSAYLPREDVCPCYQEKKKSLASLKTENGWTWDSNARNKSH